MAADYGLFFIQRAGVKRDSIYNVVINGIFITGNLQIGLKLDGFPVFNGFHITNDAGAAQLFVLSSLYNLVVGYIEGRASTGSALDRLSPRQAQPSLVNHEGVSFRKRG